MAALHSARTLFSASLLVAAAAMPATGSSLCLFADASLLLTGSRALPCALTAPQGTPMRAPAPSLACAQSLASATSTVRALHLIPTFMVASPSQRKRLIVLAHLNHGLICDVTQLVTWQTQALSVWRLPASDTFFLVQATLANRVSNGALIQGIQGTLAR